MEYFNKTVTNLGPFYTRGSIFACLLNICFTGWARLSFKQAASNPRTRSPIRRPGSPESLHRSPSTSPGSFFHRNCRRSTTLPQPGLLPGNHRLPVQGQIRQRSQTVARRWPSSPGSTPGGNRRPFHVSEHQSQQITPSHQRCPHRAFHDLFTKILHFSEKRALRTSGGRRNGRCFYAHYSRRSCSRDCIQCSETLWIESMIGIHFEEVILVLADFLLPK